MDRLELDFTFLKENGYRQKLFIDYDLDTFKHLIKNNPMALIMEIERIERLLKEPKPIERYDEPRPNYHVA